jgi:hypothetical protein
MPQHLLEYGSARKAFELKPNILYNNSGTETRLDLGVGSYRPKSMGLFIWTKHHPVFVKWRCKALYQIYL